jgi:hypothetical protein
MGGDKRGREGITVSSLPPILYSLVEISLNNANSTADFPRRPADPHNPTCSLKQSNAPSQVDEVEQVGHVRRLSARLLIHFLETNPESERRKGKLGFLVGEREGCGRWSGDDAGDLWGVGNLEPITLTVRRATRLDQELHRIDLCDARLLCVMRHLK